MEVSEFMNENSTSNEVTQNIEESKEKDGKNKEKPSNTAKTGRWNADEHDRFL